jgi:nucleotide-binding universal stress UspA family protein
MDGNSPVPRVVAGVDGSSSSFEALRWAVRHAGLIGGTVEAVTAREQPSGWFAPSMETTFDLESAREQQGRELHEVLGDEDAGKVRAAGARERR